jgi:hypothetical protein
MEDTEISDPLDLFTMKFGKGEKVFYPLGRPQKNPSLSPRQSPDTLPEETRPLAFHHGEHGGHGEFRSSGFIHHDDWEGGEGFLSSGPTAEKSFIVAKATA